MIFCVLNSEVIFLNLIYLFTNFVIGTCIASHMAVIFDRWENKNFIFSRSYCKYCHFELSLLDEIPIISYLLLRGRCRYCKQPIPSELFLFELVGGFAFSLIDFSSINGITNSVFLSSLLLTAISDFYENEFDLLFLFPAMFIATFESKLSAFTTLDFISFVSIISIFCWNILKHKMGLGDLLIYLAIASYLTPSTANIIFLFACFLLLLFFAIENNDANYHYPFIPFIFLGLIFTQFLN